MEPANRNYLIGCSSERCLGCRSCEYACALAHGSSTPRNKVVKIYNEIKVTQCQQCIDAKCIQACPIGVITQKDQQVKINEEKCIGCKACAKACPYDSIIMAKPVVKTESNKKQRLVALKCDLCYKDATEEEFNGACIKACPTKALYLTKGGINNDN